MFLWDEGKNEMKVKKSYAIVYKWQTFPNVWG